MDDKRHHHGYKKLLHRQYYCNIYSYTNTGIKKDLIKLVLLALCRSRAHYEGLLTAYYIRKRTTSLVKFMKMILVLLVTSSSKVSNRLYQRVKYFVTSLV